MCPFEPGSVVMLVMPKDMQHSCRQMFTDSEVTPYLLNYGPSARHLRALVVDVVGKLVLKLPLAWRDGATKDVML